MFGQSHAQGRYERELDVLESELVSFFDMRDFCVVALGLCPFAVTLVIVVWNLLGYLNIHGRMSLFLA